jgi:hypothetical protein
MSKTISLSLALAMITMSGLPAGSGEAARADAGDGARQGATCPRCGCCLVPVCHCYYDTKTVTTYKYTGACAEICVPGITPHCACREGHCTVYEVRKLAKYSVTKEVPVRICTIEWHCPRCGAPDASPNGMAPSAPVPPSTPAPPASPTPFAADK